MHQDYRMSATGYEETELSYHVAEDGEEGEEEEEEREESASPPREEEGVGRRLGEQWGQDGAGGKVEGSPGGGETKGGGPPVMAIPPHVLSQLLSSPGFSLQVPRHLSDLMPA